MIQQINAEADDEMDIDIESYPDDNYNPSLAYNDDEEAEDCQIQPNDALIACGVQKGDESELHVYLYVESTSALYVHHDMILSEFPLAL